MWWNSIEGINNGHHRDGFRKIFQIFIGNSMVFTNNYVEVSCEMSHPGPVSPPFPILGVSPPKGATTGITILSAHTHTNKYIIHYYTTIIYVFKYMNVWDLPGRESSQGLKHLSSSRSTQAKKPKTIQWNERLVCVGFVVCFSFCEIEITRGTRGCKWNHLYSWRQNLLPS